VEFEVLTVVLMNIQSSEIWCW